MVFVCFVFVGFFWFYSLGFTWAVPQTKAWRQWREAKIVLRANSGLCTLPFHTPPPSDILGSSKYIPPRWWSFRQRPLLPHCGTNHRFKKNGLMANEEYLPPDHGMGWRSYIVLWYLAPTFLQKWVAGTSLVVRWLRIHLPVQRILVQSLIQEDSSCHVATEPELLNYWSPHA